MSAVHLRDFFHETGISCGDTTAYARNAYSPNVEKVTCEKCKKTKLYKNLNNPK